MTGRIVNIIDIDKNNYKVKPPSWIFSSSVLALLLIYGFLIFQPSNTFELKWHVVAIVSVVLAGLFRAIIKGNYLVTLIADRKGLYFPSRSTQKYYFVPWVDVLSMEKSTFPLNSQGFRVEVDCGCFNAAVSEIGNVKKEQGRCFIYTIPQLMNRNKVIQKLERMKRSSCGANRF